MALASGATMIDDDDREHRLVMVWFFILGVLQVGMLGLVAWAAIQLVHWLVSK